MRYWHHGASSRIKGVQQKHQQSQTSDRSSNKRAVGQEQVAGGQSDGSRTNYQ